MPLPGVTPFPPEFAARYRARGYWEDRPLIAHFLDVFDAYADRVAVVDDEGSYTYAQLAAASERVALNLLDLGLKPADRVVVQLPNTRRFASLYFALQRIGAIPIMALPSHRYRELRQFVGLSGAVAAAAFAVMCGGVVLLTQTAPATMKADIHTDKGGDRRQAPVSGVQGTDNDLPLGRAARDRDVPARRRTTQHQEDQQQRKVRPQVTRLREQQVRLIGLLQRPDQGGVLGRVTAAHRCQQHRGAGREPGSLQAVAGGAPVEQPAQQFGERLSALAPQHLPFMAGHRQMQRRHGRQGLDDRQAGRARGRNLQREQPARRAAGRGDRQHEPARCRAAGPAQTALLQNPWSASLRPTRRCRAGPAPR